MEQAKALSQADEKYIQMKSIEMLPEIFKNITVDKMILLGEGQDAYKSIAQMVLPFLEIAKDLGFSKGNEDPATKTKRKRTTST